MRKISTKFLSALMVVAMLLTMLPMAAYANPVSTDEMGTIVVKAMDNETSKPLAGAIFQIRNENGQIVEQLSTVADGTAESTYLMPGRYTVQLFQTSDGYVADAYFQMVTVKKGESSLVPFTQSMKSCITVCATDQDANPLEGVKYTICNGVTGVEIATIVTDSSGYAISSTLAPGAYTVKELSAPEGYLLATSYQTPIILSANKGSFVSFPHTKQDTVLIQTVDMNTREAIGNASYEVYNLNNDFMGAFVAGADGTVVVGPLTPGDYIVKQVLAPLGYKICTESQVIKVVSDRVLNLTFANYKLSGIAIEAVAQGTHIGLANVTFAVYDADGKEVFQDTTDSSGYLVTGELPAGKYTIKQMNVPADFTAVETMQIAVVTYDELTTVVFENKAHTGLVIELVDASNADALAGGYFKVQDIGGNLITTAVTDEGGTVILPGLPAGTYIVTQTEAPDGYILEGNYQWAELKVGVEKTYVKFTNNRISGLNIRALDRNTNTPLANVVFDVYEENGKLVTTVTTDSTGVAVVTNLPSGNYLVKEVKAPEGYQVDTPTQNVTITNNENSTLTFNHVINSDITLKAVTANGAVLGGVTFNVVKANGDFVGQYTTEANGLIQLPAMEPGDYVVNIMTVPNGYILDTTARTITVKANTPMLETFIVNATAGLTIRVTEQQTGNGVKGVSLKVMTVTGVLVGNYTTNSAGYAYVDAAPGEYVVYQTYVPEDYVIDNTPYNVTIIANIQGDLEMQIQKQSHIRIQVIDANSNNGVYNVEVEILDYKNNYIGRYRTDNSGYIYLDEVLSDGRYKLKMLTVPNGYVLDTETKTVSVELNATTDIKWPITGQKGQLTITTLSDNDNVLTGIYKGSRLSGAVYTITDMSGNIVSTIYGDSYGESHSGALAVGTYYVQQVQAPMGYMLNDQRVTVNISSKNDDVKITVYNKSGNFATSIESHGPKSVGAGQQAKFFWTNIYNRSTVTVSNFFWNVKLPTDAVRAGTFYTGTYTGTANTYYIQYKTNMTDYRTLASGLSSTSQYSYDLSSLALGLNAGEYVTDIRVVFPTAVANMHESVAPVLYVTVLPNVVNGYQIINRAEAGCQGSASASSAANGAWTNSSSAAANTGTGSFGSGWTSSSSQSSTIVTNPQYPLPNTLPKTGY